nr:unnamed protein product [Naegleria fowleri]
MNIARRLVSKKKKRYQEGGFDLDLTYVTPNIIAMGFPSVGKEALFRNPMDEVQRMLKRNHGDHYKVYNLCSEKTYEPSSFDGRVERFPFDDHNAPPFEIMLPCCRSMDEWLKQDPRNVAIIHCKAGKGRTGTMICESSMDFYAESRTRNKEGVTIPSQRRYVNYFYEYLKNGIQYPRPNLSLYLDLMILLNPPQSILGGTFKLVINDKDGNTIFSYKYKSKKESDTIITVPLLTSHNSKRVPLTGDLKVLFYEINLTTSKQLFHFWVNTFFCPQNNILVLQKIEIDKISRKSTPDDFRLELQFSEAPPGEVEAYYSSQKKLNSSPLPSAGAYKKPPPPSSSSPSLLPSSTPNVGTSLARNVGEQSSNNNDQNLDSNNSEENLVEDDEDEEEEDESCTPLSSCMIGEDDDDVINVDDGADAYSSGCEYNDGYIDEEDFIQKLELKYNQMRNN